MAEETKVVTPTDPEAVVPAVSAAPLTRDQIRTKIFNAKPEETPITFMGVDLVLREPSIAEVLDFQQMEDRKVAAAMMIVRYCYIPGTNERLFDEADADGIMELPFGADMQRMQRAINKLIGAEVTEEDKSKATG